MSKNATFAAFHAEHFIRETEKDIVSNYRYILNDRSAATGLLWIKKMAGTQANSGLLWG
jgi:hypothetical protein